MPANTNPLDDQAFPEINISNLLKDYRILSQKYDEILKISQKILVELTKDKDQTKLSRFLDEKLEIGKNIELLSRKIAHQNVKSSSSQKFSLDQAKRELEKIRSKADKLWNLERKIKKLIENT